MMRQICTSTKFFLISIKSEFSMTMTSTKKKMKLKDLEMELQEVEGFSKPNVHLEQYPSSAHLA
jgi:hypothetical protein